MSHSITYNLRRSRRARRGRISVASKGVDVVVPFGTSDARIAKFVADNQGWIEQRLTALRARLAGHEGSSELCDGAVIPLRGAMARLHVARDTASRVVAIEADAGGVHVTLPDTVLMQSQDAIITDALHMWLRQQARHDVMTSVRRHGPPHGLVPSAVRIKAQKTIWGSCTRADVININWRLVLAPPHILDYVVVHELCHLEHRNHQPAFWRLVGRIMPDYRMVRPWLKDNGPLLTLKPRRV